jgi:hypothetical protein
MCPKFVLNLENGATLVPVLQEYLEFLQGIIDVGVTRSLCAAYSEPVWVFYGLTRSIQKARALSRRTRLHKTCIRNGSDRLFKNNYLMVWIPRILWFSDEWWRNILLLIRKKLTPVMWDLRFWGRCLRTLYPPFFFFGLWFRLVW